MQFFIDYDLRKQRNYQLLLDELKRFEAKPMLASSWFFYRTGTKAMNLRDHFRQFIDADDGLRIAEVNPKSWATYGALTSPAEA